MSNNLNSNNSVHCEQTGALCGLNDTTVLTKINGLIIFRNLISPDINIEDRIIHSLSGPPLKFHSEIAVPNDLSGALGRIFSIVDDEDEIEQSTCILSSEGKRLHIGRQLYTLSNSMLQAQILRIPDSTFTTIVDGIAHTKIQSCVSWNVEYKYVGNKYRSKSILQETSQKEIFGNPSVLLPDFDAAIGDCSPKNPQGNRYFFKTDGVFKNVSLCCNESAVAYCKRHNCLIYYNDFINTGKLRVLSAYTESINRKLQNSYLFRSSNI